MSRVSKLVFHADFQVLVVSNYWNEQIKTK